MGVERGRVPVFILGPDELEWLKPIRDAVPSALFPEQDKAIWIKGEKKTDLVNVPVEDNVQMIYSDLGVYDGSLGTPCDEY